jgi:hypothetical protein
MWCGAVRCGVVWCGVLWCGVVWYAAWYWYGMQVCELEYKNVFKHLFLMFVRATVNTKPRFHVDVDLVLRSSIFFFNFCVLGYET